MDRNPSMIAAENAVAWAKAPCPHAPEHTNYAILYGQVYTITSMDSPENITLAGLPIPDMPGLVMAHWPCLSRMLIMDAPEFAERIHPQYVEALDSQAGVAWVQLMFERTTGRRPKVRSWRHAPRKGCASL